MPPLLALIGRPNVGKSTLFNRLLRKTKAITHDEPGVTRDRMYGEAGFGPVRAALVDTGGFELDAETGSISEAVVDQAREAIAEAAAILFVVDGRDGLNPLDGQAAEIIRASGKPSILIVNKVDGAEIEHEAVAEFHALGFEMSPVSAAHGFGLNELRGRIGDLVQSLDYQEPEESSAEQGLRIAVLGRPNAGKSSLVNAVLGENRLIVSPVAGTTRDSVDTTFESGGKRYTFIDTAGIRRRTHVKQALERFSVMRALSSAKRADVTILVVDASLGPARQDLRLLDFLMTQRVAFILAFNKMDLVERSQSREVKAAIEREFRISPHAPKMYVSAKTGWNVGKILGLAETLWEECQIRVGTGRLNRAMEEVLERYQPPVVKRRRAKFYYLTQADVVPPQFVFFVNDPALVKASYARYLENGLRKLFGFKMAPVSVFFRASHEKKEKKKKRGRR